jgi:hypothetical protein
MGVTQNPNSPTGRTSMRVSSLRAMMAGVGIGALAACSGFRLKGPGATGVTAGGLQRPGIGAAVARAKTNPNAEVRRVCRGSRPRGFIAIDYVASDSTVCPPAPTRRSTYGTALVVRHADLPVGEEISVCADQSVPTDWIRARFDPDDPRCPEDSPPKEPRPTVMTIRRVR